MSSYRLVHYIEIDGEGEAVVILSDGEDPEENGPLHYEVRQIIDIDGDVSTFPCDRILVVK